MPTPPFDTLQPDRSSPSPLRVHNTIAGEAAEERLREYWLQRGKGPGGPGGDEVVSQVNEHEYYLAPLLPPASFMDDPNSAPEQGLLRLGGVRSVLHTAGRLLGGSDELTERRWEHLSDGVLLKEMCALLVYQHIKPCGPYGKGEELALTRLCVPGGCAHYSRYPSIYPSSHPFIYPPSIYRSIHLCSIHLSIYPSIDLSISLPRALSPSLLSQLLATHSPPNQRTPLAQEQVVACTRY